MSQILVSYNVSVFGLCGVQSQINFLSLSLSFPPSFPASLSFPLQLGLSKMTQVEYLTYICTARLLYYCKSVTHLLREKPSRKVTYILSLGTTLKSHYSKFYSLIKGTLKIHPTTKLSGMQMLLDVKVWVTECVCVCKDEYTQECGGCGVLTTFGVINFIYILSDSINSGSYWFLSNGCMDMIHYIPLKKVNNIYYAFMPSKHSIYHKLCM